MVMVRYRESGVPRPQRWMALVVGAGRVHGSPSLPLNHTVGHAIGRRPVATAPGVSTNLRSNDCTGSIPARGEQRGDAHVGAPDTTHQFVCAERVWSVCAVRGNYGGPGGSMSVPASCDPDVFS